MKRLRPMVAMMTVAGAIVLAGASAAAAQSPAAAPLSASVSASATSVPVGRSVTLDATAVNPGGHTPHSVAYAWSATAGTLSGSGSQVTYTAPNTPGTSTITVTVATGHGRSQDTATATITETVTPRIDSVEFTGPLSNPTITIDGAAFGSEPTDGHTPLFGFSGSNYGSTGNQLSFTDLSNNPTAWSAGYGADTVGLLIGTYSGTQITYQFGSGLDYYIGLGYLNLSVGDGFTVVVNGASCSGTVSLNTPIACG